MAVSLRSTTCFTLDPKLAGGCAPSPLPIYRLQMLRFASHFPLCCHTYVSTDFKCIFICAVIHLCLQTSNATLRFTFSSVLLYTCVYRLQILHFTSHFPLYILTHVLKEEKSSASLPISFLCFNFYTIFIFHKLIIMLLHSTTCYAKTQLVGGSISKSSLTASPRI